MKKLILLSIGSAAVLSVCAQKLDEAKVPAAVKTSFEKQFPGVLAKWEKEGGNYEVNFKQNDHNMSVLITPSGSITETEMDIKIAALPAPALAYVKEHYKGTAINEAAKITKADGTVNYEAEVKGKDVLFDASGKFIKESKD